MKKVISVNYVGGRCGSSMVMGLLEKSGVDVGNVSRLTDNKNAKGYFEMKEYWELLYSTFNFLGGFMPRPTKPDTINPYMYDYLTDNVMDKWKKFFDNNFTGDLIAVKSAFYFPKFIFEKLGFEVINIGLYRSIPDQAKSIRTMNDKDKSLLEWQLWLTEWYKAISDEVVKNVRTYTFEDWFFDVSLCYNWLHKDCDLPMKLNDKQLNEWVEPKLRTF